MSSSVHSSIERVSIVRPIVIMFLHCSRISGGIVGGTCSFKSAICMLSSSWICTTSSFACRKPVANFWICVSIGNSAAISRSQALDQASATTFSTFCFCVTASSHWRRSCSMLIFYSLSTCSARPALVRSSIVALSWSYCKLSRGRAATFSPNPLSRPSTVQSSAFAVISDPARIMME